LKGSKWRRFKENIKVTMILSMLWVGLNSKDIMYDESRELLYMWSQFDRMKLIDNILYRTWTDECSGLVFMLLWVPRSLKRIVQHVLFCVFVLFFFVLCTLCCQFLWIIQFWFSLRYSLTFIYIVYIIVWIVWGIQKT
jgi:hypothetical protein